MSLPVESVAFWVLAILGVLLTGVSKSGFAGGAGVIAVPMLAFVVTVPQATALMLPLLICMDLRTIHYYRHHIHRDSIKALLPAAVVGIVIGGLILGLLPDTLLQLVLGISSVLFALWGRLAPWFGRIKSAGVFWGAMSGFTSTLIHSGGPPIQMYLLSQGLPKLVWLATTGIMFGAMNVVKIVPYSMNGQWSGQLFMVALVLIPVALVGVKLGYVCQGRMSERLFLQVCRGCLLVTGILLIGRVVWVQ